jgi:hypothetical protein
VVLSLFCAPHVLIPSSGSSGVRVNLAMVRVAHQPLVIGLLDFQQLLPNTLVAPAYETPVRVAPSSVLSGPSARHGVPVRNIQQYRIDEMAIVRGNAPPEALASRSMQFQQGSGLIGYIVAAVGGI